MLKKRSFEILKETMTEEQLIKFCTKIATLYATSESNFARSYFTENFNISTSCYNKILELAVVRNMVNDKMVDKMEKKAIANQNMHAEGAGATSIVHYSELRVERRKFILSTFSNEKIIEIIHEFIEKDIFKNELAEKYNVDTKVIDLIIKRGIVENLISDELFHMIELRTLKRDNSCTAKNFFIKLHEERNSNKATLK